jgi:hypothetical protein
MNSYWEVFPCCDNRLPFKRQRQQSFATDGTNYDLRFIEREYPEGITDTASKTTDGYIIVYNQNVVTRQTDPAFFEPQNSRQGTSQGRPPVEMQFRVNNFGIDFSFFTWHAEATKSLAQGHVQPFYTLVTNPSSNFGHWILAGDLNVELPGLQGAIEAARALNPRARLPEVRSNQELHHYDNSLDYIISDQTAGNFIPDDGTPKRDQFWGRLLSDSKHYALFAYITFGQ